MFSWGWWLLRRRPSDHDRLLGQPILEPCYEPAIVSRFATLACCLLTCLAFVTPASAAERVLVGYYATFGDLPIEQLPWDRLTHVCHAFLRVDAEGELVKTDAMPNAAISAEGRQHDTPVLVTLGGGNTVKGLEKITRDDGSTRAFVEEVLEVVDLGRYDGLDLDWEFPRNADTRDAHARLVLELRRQLDELAGRTERKTAYLLTATVSPSSFFGQYVDVEKVVPAVDWLSVMTYDMSGPWSKEAAHHAPLFPSSSDPEKADRSVTGAMRYWESERGVPKSKLVVGAPLFGRAMPASEPYALLDQDRGDQHRAMPYASVRKLVGKGWRATWDNETRSPWLQKPAPKKKEKASSPLTPISEEEAGEGPIVICYDDRNSTHLKASWAREQGYRGLFFWAIHQDRMSDNRHWLLDSANKAWPAE